MVVAVKRMFLLVSAIVMIIGCIHPAFAMDVTDGNEAKADQDRDGLTTLQEFVYGTDPNDPDSDGGGVYDGWEVWYDTHRAIDLKTGNEYIAKDYHFDPNWAGDDGVVADRDGLILERDQDASVFVNDPDNDGWNNLHEFLVGTDPTNPNTDGDCYLMDSADPHPTISEGECKDPTENGGPGSGQGEWMAILEM
jgi:hypothetical protein